MPYSRDIADQRRKYGESMLRRGDEHLATQKEFEVEAQAKLDAARQRRQFEKEKLEALEVRALGFHSILFQSYFRSVKKSSNSAVKRKS